MEIEVVFKKDIQDSITTRVTIPISEQTKQDLEWLKKEQKIDVNAMARDFFGKIIQRARNGELQA